MIEFMPWYEGGATLLRCGGDGGCGALLSSGDTELHTRWHKRIEDTETLLARTMRTLTLVVGAVTEEQD